ncbi:serine-rich adhesin for platelets isoform X2 [Drosophila pseudoobscura]|uniref:Serine-rich adhesin for platelets isoform X2 n=1 Tax=Drosophila pseudoobscura pseudoobscura TaxID=46245 RepID=A0A6I8W1Y5_DROPS|nr:serine-rich adhesin for platelets isoform X2 [Drosophila pseudoobscura]
MLHNNTQDNAEPTTTTATTTPTATATTTTGHETEPTISTHFATTAAATNVATRVTETVTVAAEAVSSPPPAATAASPEAAAEGQALTAPPSTSLLLLSPVAERTELAETADVSGAASAAAAAAAAATAQQQPLSSVARTGPAVDVQMRTHQRQKIKSYHDAKQTAVWRTDSLVSNPSSTMCPDSSLTPAAAGVVVGLPMRGVVLSTAPSILQRKSSDSSLLVAIPRRVSFPDNALVTGYLEPANPWKQACLVRSITEIVDQYDQSCRKHRTEPLESILNHLNGLDLTLQARQPLLSLKGNQLTANDCEALEEIFKRIQYKTIDLSECALDESCLSPLFQMIEYYEAAIELDISYNKETMTKRCWELCAYMVERSQELQLLNAESNQITRLGAESLGRALQSSNLHTLKLEHCGLRGPPLTELCKQMPNESNYCFVYYLWIFTGHGLHKNKMLKELWMGYNDLECTDAKHIADMLRYNHSLELIDISNNNIRDEGCMYLLQDLILQSTELERRLGALKRARAIEVDDSMETDYSPSSVSQSETNFSFCEDRVKDVVDKTNDGVSTAAGEPSTAVEQPPASSSNSEAAVAILVEVENDNEDDNTEDDTVRTVKNCNGSSGGGQSMLDKLLSMNSDSSSSMEEPPSTDTLAACCSEDISEISNEIFDASGKQQQQKPQSEEAKAKEITEGATEESSTDVEATSMASAAEDSTEEIQQQQQQQQSSQNERNLCDITPSTEAKTVEPKPNESCVQNNNSINNNNNTTQAAVAAAASTAAPQNDKDTGVSLSHSHSPSASSTPPAGIYEVTAEESDCCINGGGNGVAMVGGSRPLDVNKNTKSAGDDFEDTHSMDSAFESASEGDISRHLPDEFSRLSVSLESTRLDDMAKEMGGIETATIATESTECLLVAEEAAAPVAAAVTPTPLPNDSFQQPKVTIAEECRPSTYSYTGPSPTPTPPPPSTSPGGASIGMRRTESSCAYLNQSTRNWSHSAESLCSDISLDGNNSNNSTNSTGNDPDFADKLTKNDTLSRRQLAEAANLEAANRAPSGLKALTMWNNNLTKECAASVAELLEKTISLELLNIGKNCLSNDFVSTIKESLTKNTTLTTLGLQSAHLSAKGIETLASILSFGGNSKLQRIDIRDNKLEVESLNIIAEVLKSNKTLTQIDINDEPKRLTIGSDAHLDYTRVLDTVRSMCFRNEKMQAQELTEKAAIVGGAGINSNSSSSSGFNSGYRCRGGYYLGSRKISLTCQSRPFVDANTGTVTSLAATVAMPTSAAALLEVKRKTGTRLRSPGPSPPTISPSSSPNRSRFHVSRVAEVSSGSISSPLISPLAQMPPQHPPTPRSASSCMSIPTIGGCSPSGSQSSLNAVGVGTLPTSSSLPAMASVTSSTQTIKRLSVSPRSRFHVSRIYEDPQVPMANRQLPPITPHTPPIDLPPTPMLKSSRKAVQLSEAVEAAAAAAATATSGSVVIISNVVIVEPTIDEPDESDAQRNSTNADEAAGQKLSPHFSHNSPISSNSCSTSPGSSGSSISSGSTSSSSSTNACAGSSSSSTSTDITDSISSGPPSGCSEPVPRLCPLAVFGDNDITLTKESAAVVALSAAVPAPVPEADPETVETEPEPEPAPVSSPQPTARSRKTSWIANPSAVDKLLTLFNPGTIFQRSSSPEQKASQQQVSGANTATNNAQTDDGNATTQTSILSVTRKTSPSSWTSLTGGSHCATSNSNSNSNSNLDSVSGTGSSSFLDTASRQLRDFSKQVFRQNISFNNSGDGAASSGPAGVQLDGNGATGTTTTSSSSSTESASPPECNAAHMPPSLKRQLKENISPEHTINEETLHTLQKLSRVEDVATLKAEAAAELGDIEIVMYSEVVHCLPEEPTQNQKSEPE